MTTTLNTPRTAFPGRASGLTFLGALRSEWIKLTSLRSSIIILAITVLGMAGIGLLGAWAVGSMADTFLSAGAAQAGGGSDIIAAQFGPAAKAIPASGIVIAQMLIGSLAVMQIGSEYGNRMISTTLTAVPRRITAILAKTIVIAGTAFIVGAASSFLAYLVAQPLLETHGLDFPVTADGVLQSVAGAGAYLALMAVLGLGIGGILRNSAGGIMATLGLLLVLPVVAAILAGTNKTVADVSRYLPSAVGMDMVAINPAPGALTQGEGSLVMLAWSAAALIVALVLVKRRDA